MKQKTCCAMGLILPVAIVGGIIFASTALNSHSDIRSMQYTSQQASAELSPSTIFPRGATIGAEQYALGNADGSRFNEEGLRTDYYRMKDGYAVVELGSDNYVKRVRKVRSY